VTVAHGLLTASLQHWSLEPVTIGLLVLSAVAYFAGVRALWARAGHGQGISRRHVAAHGAAIASVVLALISPLPWLSARVFSAHMGQHEILMLMSAPLFVLSQPLLAYVWALPATLRLQVAAAFRQQWMLRAWHVLTGPFAVFALHAAVLWAWHAPTLFEAALANEGVHVLQHLSFLFTGALFWWGMVRGRYGRVGYGVAVLYVFLTGVHSSLLGALMTVSERVWYSSYAGSAPEWSVDPLVDQQLAGLLMWVPSGVIFIVLGLALLSAWLGESERRTVLAGRVRSS
jgi:cytochrome c oxidase assembly factor CtaG